MELELVGKEKVLGYKVKACSRESPSQKATNVLDADLRTHWSAGTNTKEWILVELNEPCLLSHLRLYNKSVLEWEIAVGLQYKPETFVKVRPRCEAPRREIAYDMSYTPCRYVKVSCLRGNPIAIFFIQLMGVPVSGLELEFQPVVNYLLPQIIAHKQDVRDIHLQLLQDLTERLLPFVPQLEADLTSFSDAPDSSIRVLAMLAGPLYPILHIVNERETTGSSMNASDSEVPKNNPLSSALTVSSNFENSASGVRASLEHWETACSYRREKSRLREEIIARRQKKLLMRHNRQKFLEDASIREAELQRELDRERAIEAEKEIERQRLLEIERARTKELRHNLDLERERQAQRELQHELEQIESGIRLSRREQSSSSQSRSRDRYRERENGRAGNEGGGRTSGGTFQTEAGSSSVGTVPTIVLSGSRSYTGLVPTILQSRDRPDDCSSSYEEVFDGSKDSGDTSSVGDPESISAFEGYPSRQGQRGSKSRTAVERRERDRREGKWERKH